MFDSDSMRTAHELPSVPMRPLYPQKERLPYPQRIAPVFAITSGKGGVGKTTVTANLAAALASKGLIVLVIDADVGLANLDLFFNVKPLYTLADLLTGAAQLDDIILRTVSGVLLLPGASGIQKMTALNSAQKLTIASILESWTSQVDLVLVDTCTGISDAATYFAVAAQEIIVMITPEPASLTDAYAFIKILASTYREKRFRVIANKVEDQAQGQRLFESLSRAAVRFLNVSTHYLGWIPRDPRLLEAVTNSSLVVEVAKNAPATRAFADIADDLLGLAIAGGRLKENVQFRFRRALKGLEGTK